MLQNLTGTFDKLFAIFMRSNDETFIYKKIVNKTIYTILCTHTYQYLHSRQVY